MIARASGQLAVSPILNYPRSVEAGKTYLLTLDFKLLLTHEQWPYSAEEYCISCILNGSPLFQVDPLGESSVIVHRFGGTYGPARFLLTATTAKKGTIRITLVNSWGVPLDIIETPLIHAQHNLEDQLSDLMVKRRQQAPQPTDSASWFNSSLGVSSRLPFDKSLAVVIGIDHYIHGISPLQTAVADAQVIAQCLLAQHNYSVYVLENEKASLIALQEFLRETLPKLLTANSRLLVYFAGHGIALDNDDGPAGYLIPQDAVSGEAASYISISELLNALTELPCRHFLGILDCNFSGSFRWTSAQNVPRTSPSVLYQEKFNRFIQDPAWQIIASTAYDQGAADAFDLNERLRNKAGDHSSLAEALCRALQGDADSSLHTKDDEPAGNGVTTATDLYLYLRDQVEVLTEGRGARQLPKICTLSKHDQGEYLFLTPGHMLNLPLAPELTSTINPYLGLRSFEQEHKFLFFGQDTEIERLLKRLDEPHPMIVVLGASGTGKSSLVKAGLLPRVSDNSVFHMLPVMRPGNYPFDALARACVSLGAVNKVERLSEQFAENETILSQLIGQWQQTHPDTKLLLVIDQAEELITQSLPQAQVRQFQRLIKRAMAEHRQHFRVVVTLRADFEAQFQDGELRDEWMDSRFLISPMNQAQLREVIERPAELRVLYFKPSSLVNQIIDDLDQMPGALPLLSFTLSELYRRYLQSPFDNRVLTAEAYQALGGVTGALNGRATQEYEFLLAQDAAYEKTVKHVMLRMVAVEGGDLARRRVSLSELVYSSEAENERVRTLLRNLIAARLLVRGQEEESEPYVEPAHDALVRGWRRLLKWIADSREELILLRRVTAAAEEWESNRDKELLWNNHPSLSVLEKMIQSQQPYLNNREIEFVRQSIKQLRRWWNPFR